LNAPIRVCVVGFVAVDLKLRSHALISFVGNHRAA
jgi:hypothetical protein